MYRKVDNSLDFIAREEATLAFWDEEKIFEKQRDLRRDGEIFTFYDGPPTANGKPHIGHILTRAIKDLIPRYQSMLGKNVLRKAGWDTHGLPVELEVEKALGINGKEQIEAYGIEPFIQKCKESVWKYQHEWEDMSKRVGFWVDMRDPYVTYHDDYIESEWWALKKIWEKGLLYQGHKVVPYCPRCGTALASHEVAQGYHSVRENSIYVRFKVRSEEKTWLAAWTTTPWTLPSNVALAVHPDIDYALVAYEGERYYMAEALIPSVLGEKAEYEIIRKLKGRELEYLEYEPILPYADACIARMKKKSHYVTLADYVSVADGSGIVHIAPAFGEDDSKVGQAYDLPFVQLVRLDGTMPEEVTDFAGIFCKEADPLIIKKLRADGTLMRVQSYEHDYPFCWRCDTPLIYYARDGWFIRMTELRDQLLANNATINWIPESIGSGRFGNFLENVVDWAISRERYWGMPLPIWRCSCGYDHVVGSVQELKEMAISEFDIPELHRPFIDQVELRCPECGGHMHRVPEVIDCWFDSGSMPFAQWHYPFENKEIFEEHFPADFISEAVDQTRGWFNSLLSISTLLFEQAPYRNCLVLGHVQDKDGQKMSKHKGNVVSPDEALNTAGADAVRWYFYSNSSPWLPSRFSLDAVNEGKRRFMGTFWNSYAFFVLYAEIDHFDPSAYPLEEQQLSLMDRWILSRLNTLILEVRKSLDAYDIYASAKKIEAFTDELSNWYVRRGRERYWGAEMSADKAAAYRVLYEVLLTLSKLAAPFTPFMAEDIYRNLTSGKLKDAPESVHLCDYPLPDPDRIDKKLEEQMRLTLRIVGLGRAARTQSGLKTRQPLQRLLLVSEKQLESDYEALVLDELNVKTLVYASDTAALESYVLKPQLRLLGKRFGSKLNELKRCLEEMDGTKAYRELKESGKIVVEMSSGQEALSEEELIIETRQTEGFSSVSDRGLTVALDTTLTEELIEEGMIREIVSRVQSLRKESGFDVTDRIVLAIGGNEKITDIAFRHSEELQAAVLAVDLRRLGRGEESGENPSTDFELRGQKVKIAVSRVH